jgi:hypothetical protein
MSQPDEILESLIAETPDVTVRGSEFERNGVVFAARPDPHTVELRLGPDIAEAAMNTPGTHPSPRGDDWVALKPANWADADDRLEAWYRVAWRMAPRHKK